MLLDQLIMSWENETVEFKQAGRDYNTDKIGEYFSALSNEANLRDAEAAWLVFGVNDKTRQVVGTDYRLEPDRLQSLKRQIAQGTEPSVTFREIHELTHKNGRVILMEIPPAPAGIPIAWQGHYFARAGESLVSLGLDKLDQIRRQSLGSDWSAAVVPNATLADFDPQALDSARGAFAKRYPHLFTEEDVMGWPVATFTDRANLTVDGQVTRTGLLLVGRPESAAKLSPYVAWLVWSLVGSERAYEHFSTPFILSTTALYQRIRNIQLRMVKPGTLFPVEVSKYDRRMVLEALHNCIAHQDYTRAGRVIVQEFPDRLVFSNEGEFFDGTPEDYVTGIHAPKRYRNTMLAKAMVELGMIDTLGYGIYDMHNRQMHRYLPMPDYDLSDPHAVTLTIYGAVIDEAYTNLLMQRTDLPLTDILALDRVQKSLPIPESTTRRLKRAGLIEGRKPHLQVAQVIEEGTTPQANVVQARFAVDAKLLQTILDYLAKNETSTRRDIDVLLANEIPATLTSDERARKTKYLLAKLRRDGLIHNTGTKAKPTWTLVSSV